jgi:hypothetical protein
MRATQLSALGAMSLALSFAYLLLIAYLIGYLRRVHTATWVQLGRPSIPARVNPFDLIGLLRALRVALLTGRFMFLSNQHSKLDDARVTNLIWSIRILLVVCFLLSAIQLKLSP